MSVRYMVAASAKGILKCRPGPAVYLMAPQRVTMPTSCRSTVKYELHTAMITAMTMMIHHDDFENILNGPPLPAPSASLILLSISDINVSPLTSPDGQNVAVQTGKQGKAN